MFLERHLTHEFDGLIEYASHINHLSGGTAMALMVIRNGRVVTEHYEGRHGGNPEDRLVGPDSQFNVGSARKSYIGFAVALAVYEGKIGGIDDPVIKYLPELDRGMMANTTIRHLLTHTHGVEFDSQENRRLYREYEAGTDWAYRGANIIMLTEIVQRTMGRTVSEILQERVFDRLGFTQTVWRDQPTDDLVKIVMKDRPDWFELGSNTTGAGDQSNLYVSAQEFAYWGYLHLHRGRIGGEQVAPAAVFELATSVQSPPMDNLRLPRHGFLWYVKDRAAELSEIGDRLPTGTFQILGITGPLILVIPRYDIVIARMYNQWGNYGGPDGTQWLRYLREFGDRAMDYV